MKTEKLRFKNRLAQFREMRNLNREQVAKLLGHRNIRRISNYEEGRLVPNLKIALKLAQIYNIPIRVMLDKYYLSCRLEVEQEKRRLKSELNNGGPEEKESSDIDFCSYEQLLTSSTYNEANLLKVRHHASYLVRRTAELLGHM